MGTEIWRSIGELNLLKKIYDFLSTGASARAMELDEDEVGFMESLNLICIYHSAYY